MTIRPGDFLELRSVLPARSSLELGLYHQLLINDFSPAGFRDPMDLCADQGNSSIIFSADEDDEGSLFLFDGCEGESLRFLPQETALGRVYEQCLICLDGKGFLSSFFANFIALEKNSDAFLFARPKVVNWRKKRIRNRIQTDGEVIVLRRNNQAALLGKLHDISSSGASFLLAETDLGIGEMVLLEIRIPRYPQFESTALVVRRENQIHRNYRLFFAARLLLTRGQRHSLQHILHTLSGASSLLLPRSLPSQSPGSQEAFLAVPQDTALAEQPSRNELAASVDSVQISTILNLALPYQPNFALPESPTPEKKEMDSPSIQEQTPPISFGTMREEVDYMPLAESLSMASTGENTAEVKEEKQLLAHQPPDLTFPLAKSESLIQDSPQQLPSIDPKPSPEPHMSEEILPNPSTNEIPTPTFAPPRAEHRWRILLDHAELLCSRAEILAETDRALEALHGFDEALQMLKELPGADAKLPRLLDFQARCHLGRANALFALGDSQAIQAVNQSIALLEPAWQGGALRRPHLGRELAQAFLLRAILQGDRSMSEAIQDYHRAQEILDTIGERLGKENEAPDTLNLRARLALCQSRLYEQEGQYVESLQSIESALEYSHLALERVPDAVRWSPETSKAVSLLQKASIYFQMGREEEAETLTSQGLETWLAIQQRLGEQFTVSQWNQLAAAHLQVAAQLWGLERIPQAQQALEQARTILERLQNQHGEALPPAIQHRLATLHHLEAEITMAQGNAPHALREAESAIAILRSLAQQLGNAFSLEMRDLLGSAILFTGKVYRALGDHQAALAAMDQAQQVLAA
ncbi:MAG: PilZ domain-containing protein [Acidithiobacillus sp.]|nr:PilZ domain-containing protein [Acidithiobacillus sp.]